MRKVKEAIEYLLRSSDRFFPHAGAETRSSGSVNTKPELRNGVGVFELLELDIHVA